MVDATALAAPENDAPFDLFSIVTDVWDASEIEDQKGSHRIKYRFIGEHRFQFKLLDIKERTRLGFGLGGQIEKFSDVFKAAFIAKASGKAVDRTAMAAVLAGVLPTLMARLSEDDFYNFIANLWSRAALDVDGKFIPLTDVTTQERAFGSDLTLQIAVALTVLEVNLAEGFFDRIKTLLESATPQIEESSDTLASTGEKHPTP